MLQELFLENFIIFSRLRLSFEPGLNAITGESGAGKSLLLEALVLLLGGRASVECIRAGSSRALVEGVFRLDRPGPWRELLAGLDPGGEDGAVWLSREISRSGRGSCRVNGRPVPLGVLQELGRGLAEIQGQNSQLALLSPVRQLVVLDSYAGPAAVALRQQVEELYKKRERVEQALAECRAGGQARARRVAELRLALQEIAAARLVPGEEAGLLAERTLLANSGRLVELLGRAENLLAGDNSGSGGADLLARALADLRQAAALSGDARLRASQASLEESFYNIQEVARDLRDFRERLEFAPERLGEVEDRLALLHRLKRVYQREVEELIGYQDQAQAELEALAAGDRAEEELLRELGRCQEELDRLAAGLGELRRTAARKLAEGVNEALASLELAQARLEVHLEDLPQVGARGGEVVEYLFAPNPGEGFKPLARIASGGELARVLLALRAVLAASDDTPLLVFDEIDTGSAGAAVQRIAGELLRLSRSKQVICVTHSPQVAALADCHILVTKESEAGWTAAQAVLLENNDRTAEIARLLGNQDLEIARRHAGELLRLAQATKAGPETSI